MITTLQTRHQANPHEAKPVPAIFTHVLASSFVPTGSRCFDNARLPG